jgi:uncharacterized protein
MVDFDFREPPITRVVPGSFRNIDFKVCNQFRLYVQALGGVRLGFSQMLRSGLGETGIRIEPMDTGAACRTDNVLLAEGRPVGAALIAVD